MKKKNFKSRLNLKKNAVSSLTSENLKGGDPWTWGCNNNTVFCPTNGALNSCPPPGVYCL